MSHEHGIHMLIVRIVARNTKEQLNRSPCKRAHLSHDSESQDQDCASTKGGEQDLAGKSAQVWHDHVSSLTSTLRVQHFEARTECLSIIPNIDVTKARSPSPSSLQTMAGTRTDVFDTCHCRRHL